MRYTLNIRNQNAWFSVYLDRFKTSDVDCHIHDVLIRANRASLIVVTDKAGLMALIKNVVEKSGGTARTWIMRAGLPVTEEVQ